MKTKILGVITARGGSKGIPGKNIKPLLGKPLIAYTIEAAQRSNALDRLILSTDDPAIAEVAKKYGCEVPFLRPKELAEDKSAHLPVMQHAAQWLRDKENYNPDYVMILQPTSPLRQSSHIKESVELALKTGADSVLSVSEVPENFNSKKTMRIDDSGMLKLLNGDPIYKRIARRQDLSKEYWSTGAIYLFKTDLLFHPTNPNFYGEKTMPLVIDKKYVVDINVPADWEEAEKAMKLLSYDVMKS